MFNMWFRHILFPSNSWRQDQLTLIVIDAGYLGNISSDKSKGTAEASKWRTNY
jgi:hypothetical protein